MASTDTSCIGPGDQGSILPSEPDRLGRAFAAGRPALVAYAMAGYPTREHSLEAVHALAEAGADLIELGVPYADPMADGPTIRDAAVAARAAAEGGFGLAETVELAAAFLGEAGPGAPPVAVMTYLNPLMRAGYVRAAESLRAGGVGGVIVPDLPPEMARPWLSVSEGLDTVFLVAPTSTEERLAKVGTLSSGFVYCVSTTGVTGARDELPPELTGLVERVKAATELPVAVGFGIGTPEQAAVVARQADGVVVGSAFVKQQHDPAALRAFAGEVADAVHSARHVAGHGGARLG